MDLLSLLVRIGADTSEAEKGIKKTQTLGQKFSKGIKTATKAAGVAIAAATTAVVGFTKSSIEAGAKFDASMSNVGAISGASAKEMEKLRDKAKEMGAKTKFSASEAADAFSYMAMAGWKTEDMLEGIDGIMNLAAASGEDLATTSDIVTDALTAFGLEAKDSGHFADIMAAASSNANTNVSMMGETFKYVAPVAGALGMEADDVAVAIGLMANAGIKGSQAGTSLRGILTRMVKPTKESSAAMKELGISVTNSDGSMKSMDEIMVTLRDKFDGLTEAQQAEYAAMIAGQEGMSGLLAIVNASETDFNKLTNAVENCDGAAESMAATMQDNLAGDITIFKSALEGAQIALSDVLTPALRDFVQFGTSAVADLTKAFEEDGLNGAMDALGHIISDGINLILDGLPGFVDAGIQLLGAIVTGIIDNIPKLVDAAGQIIETLVDAIIKFVSEFSPEVGGLLQTLWDYNKALFEGVVELWNDVLYPVLQTIWTWVVESLIPAIQSAVQNLQPKIEAVVTAIKKFWEETLKPALEDLWTFIVDTVVPKVIKAWNDFKATAAVVFDNVKNFWDTTLKPALSDLWTFIVDTVVPKVQTAWNDFKNTASIVFAAIKGFWITTLKPALEALWTFVVETVVPKVREAWNNMKNTASVVFSAISGFWTTTLKPALEALWTFVVDTVVPKVREAWNNMKNTVSVVFNAIKTFWTTTLKPVLDTLWTFVVETVVPKVREAWNNMKNTVSIVFNAIKGFWTTTLSPIFEAIKTYITETLWPQFRNIFNAIKATVQTCFSAISDLWNYTVKPIYEGIVTFFTGVFHGDMTEAWDGIKGIVEGVWNGLETTITTFVDNAKTWGRTLLKNLKLGIEGGWNFVKSAVEAVWNSFPQGIKDAMKSALDWGKGILTSLKIGVQNGWDAIKQWFTQLWEDIKAIPKALVDAALNWGADLINNFKAGIEQKWEDLKAGVVGIGQGIKDLLGFSQPEEGPLSDFDTYAPDMIDLFVQGINDSVHKITTAMGNMVNNIKVAFKLAGSGAYTEFNTGLNGIWGNQLENAIKTPFNNAIYAVQHMNWRSLGWNVKDDFLSGLNGLYESVKRAFDFSNIYVKTPHWSVRRWNEISGSYYPDMEVKWYRKAYDNPVMFTEPTVLPTAGGAKGFGDGIGGEVVLSASKLRELVGSGGGVTNNNTFNLYQREGEDMEQFARRIEDILTRQQNQRKAAFA